MPGIRYINHLLQLEIRYSSGMEASDIKKIQDLEDENRRLRKRSVCRLSARTGRWALSKKALKPAFKRELVTHLSFCNEWYRQRACRSLNLKRTVYHYRPDYHA